MRPVKLNDLHAGMQWIPLVPEQNNILPYSARLKSTQKSVFPYILLISLASLVGAILNTWNRFSIPAFAPTLLNISMIGFALFAAPYFNPPVLALAAYPSAG